MIIYWFINVGYEKKDSTLSWKYGIHVSMFVVSALTMSILLEFAILLLVNVKYPKGIWRMTVVLDQLPFTILYVISLESICSEGQMEVTN